MTKTRDVVADLWCELLDIDDVKPDDDFFQLGGDSLLAVEFTAAVEERLGVDYDLGSFFDASKFGDVVASLESPTSDTVRTQ